MSGPLPESAPARPAFLTSETSVVNCGVRGGDLDDVRLGLRVLGRRCGGAAGGDGEQRESRGCSDECSLHDALSLYIVCPGIVQIHSYLSSFCPESVDWKHAERTRERRSPSNRRAEPARRRERRAAAGLGAPLRTALADAHRRRLPALRRRRRATRAAHAAQPRFRSLGGRGRAPRAVLARTKSGAGGGAPTRPARG